MALPEPEPGLVFRYDYLWSREAKAGKQTSKDRPACVAVSTDTEEGPRLAVILPITHSKPSGSTVGIEIPPKVRRHLGLDDQPCWIIVSEHNVDDWPNPGIAPLTSEKRSYSYGFLPPIFFDVVQSEFLKRFDRNRGVRR
jgi:hypothetical protein